MALTILWAVLVGWSIISMWICMATPFLGRHAGVFSIPAFDPGEHIPVRQPLRLGQVDAAAERQAGGVGVHQLAPRLGGIVGEVDPAHVVPEGHARGVVKEAAIRYSLH